MTGFQSKKKSRHADEITLDHLIKLRTENERLREALQNVLSAQPIKWDEGITDIVLLAKALLKIDSIARAALEGKE